MTITPKAISKSECASLILERCSLSHEHLPVIGAILEWYMPEWLTLDEASAAFKLSRYRLTALAKARHVRSMNTGTPKSNKVLFRSADLRAMFDAAPSTAAH